MSNHDTSLWEKIIQKQYHQRELQRKYLLGRVIDITKQYFSNDMASRIYIFGSLIKSGDFYEYSDIDIAIEGLKGDFFKIISELESIIGRNIDIIEIEKSRFKEHIQRHGLRIL